MEIPKKSRDIYKRSSRLFILFFALEYMLGLVVNTTYLAKLATYIGMSDASTGTLISLFSYGTFFQLIALSMPKWGGGNKRLCLIITVLNRILCIALYVIPFFALSKGTATSLFVITSVIAIAASGAIGPLKSVWFANLAKEGERGVLHAKNEIVSLILGMIISLALSSVMDYCEALGKIETAFIIYIIVMLLMSAASIVTMIFIKERPDNSPKTSLVPKMKEALRNINLRYMLPFHALMGAAFATTVPFLSTYQISDLKFSMVFISILSIIVTVVRSSLTLPIARLGDTRSFISSLNIGFSMHIASFVICMFTVPENGAVMYVFFSIFSAVGYASTASGPQNLLFDYIPYTMRTEALTLFNVVWGAAGMLASLAVTPLVNYIQGNGNTFLFFEHVYAQQILAFISIIIFVITVLYMNLVIARLKKPRSTLLLSDEE